MKFTKEYLVFKLGVLVTNSIYFFFTHYDLWVRFRNSNPAGFQIFNFLDLRFIQTEVTLQQVFQTAPSQRMWEKRDLMRFV